MSKKGKYIIGSLLACLCLLIIVLSGGQAYIESDHAARWIQKRLNAAIPGSVGFKRLRLSIMTLSLGVDQLDLSDSSDRKIAGFDMLSLDISLSDIFRGDVIIEDFELRRPWADIKIDNQGSVNLLKAVVSGASSSEKSEDQEQASFPLNIVVRNMTISGGVCKFESAAHGLALTANGLSITLGGNLQKKTGQLQLHLIDGTYDDARIRSTFGPLAVHGTLTEDRISISKMDFESPALSLKFSGDIGRIFSKPIFNMQLNGNIRLEDICQVMNLKKNLTGRLDLVSNFRGTTDKPEISCTLDYGGGLIYGHRINECTLKAEMNPGRLRISQVQVTAPAGKIALTGAADFSTIFPNGRMPDTFDIDMINRLKALPVDFEMKAGVDLIKIAPFFPLNSNSFPISGRLDARLKIEGTPNNPIALLEGNYGGGVIFGQNIDDVKFRLNLKDKRIDIRRLNVKIGGGLLKVGGGIDLVKMLENGLPFQSVDTNAISYHFQAECENLKMEDVMGRGHGLSGGVSGHVSINGSGIEPERITALTQVRFVSDNLSSDSFSGLNPKIFCRSLLDKGKVRLENLDIDVNQAKMQARGDYDISSDMLDAEVILKAAALSDILAALGIKDISGAAELEARIHGKPRRPKIQLKADAAGLGLKKYTLGDLSIQAQGKIGDQLTVSHFVLKNQGSLVQASGKVPLLQDMSMLDAHRPIECFFSFENVEIKDFIKSDVASGTLAGNVNILGSYTSPTAQLNLVGNDIAANAWRIGDVNANMAFSGGQLNIRQFNITNRRSSLNIAGSAQILAGTDASLSEDPTMAIRLASPSIYIQDFVKDYKGKVTLDAQIMGSFKKPEADFKLNVSDFESEFQKLKGIELDGKFDGNGEKVEINTLKINVQSHELIEGRGWMDLDRNFDIALKTRGVSLKHIDRVRVQKEISGNLIFDLTCNGSFDDPKAAGIVSVSDVKIKGKPVDDIKLRLDTGDRLIRITGDAGFGIKGHFHIEQGTFMTVLKFDQTDFEPYFKIVGVDDVNGRLTGVIEASGNTENIESIQASVNIDDLNIRFGNHGLVQSRRMRAEFKNRRLTISDAKLKLFDEGFLNIDGTGVYKGNIRFNINGRLPLSRIQLLFQDFPKITGGVSDISASIGGTVDRPEIRGNIDIEKIETIIPETAQKLAINVAHIRITPDALKLEKLEGRLDTGSFNIQGQLDLADYQLRRVRLSIDALALPVKYPDTLDMLVNLNMRVSGTHEKSTVAGSINILKGTYFKDVELSLLNEVTTRKRETKPVAPDPLHPFLDNMDVDISVSAREAFLVNNDLALLHLRPDLKIIGSINRPVLTGRARVESGTLHYQSKDFEVKKGVVDFLNPYRIEPTIDIHSQTVIRKWTIYLNMKGKPDELIVKTSSSPQELDKDILSLLLTGKTLKELIDGEGGNSQSTGQLLAEMVASTFGEDIQQYLGLDSLEVETTGKNGTSGANDHVKVTVGKDLTNRLSMKYSVASTDGEMVQTAISEYKLLDHFLLNGFQNSEGTFGGELRFRLEFR